MVANYVTRPKVKLINPLPLSREEAQQALCYLVVGIATPHYTSAKAPAWASGFIERVSVYLKILEEVERRTSGKSRKGKDEFLDWVIVRWLEEELKRLDIFDLRALIERVEIPLEKVQADLAILLPAMPTHIRLSDGVEHIVAWGYDWCDGACHHIGTIYLSNRFESIFETVEVDQADPRTSAIRTAGNVLRAKILKPCQYPVEAFESPFSGMGCYEATRRLI
jgi:hypothetical protein